MESFLGSSASAGAWVLPFLVTTVAYYITRPMRLRSSQVNNGVTYMSLKPLPERGGIDLDDGALDEGVCANQLVVGGIVDDADDPRLAGDML